MAETLKRRWWKKKRVWAAAVPLLVAAYPASFGPACYVYGRGRLPPPVKRKVFALYRPMTDAADDLPGGRLLMDYGEWWGQLGARHAGSE